ncbi:MAG: magnesium transporter CorA family protein [Nanoarchaeota archaeon]|nr:magnesium transporter CorA family protein [Nanoarchaeota archaeon]
MIEYYKRGRPEEPFKISSSYVPNSWVKVIDPTNEEIDLLSEKFGLDKSAIHDGLDAYETPRIDEDGGEVVYLFVRVPTMTVPQQTTYSLLVIIAKNNIITISKENLEIFEAMIGPKMKLITTEKTKMILKILSEISEKYNFNVRKIMKEVKSNKKNLLKLVEKDIHELVLQEDILNDYLSSFRPLMDMYNKLLRIKSIKFLDKDKEFIEDLIVDLNQTFNTCEFALKSISNMRDYYATTISGDLNKILTVLTIFTVFLAIPMLIGSLFGMNIEIPLQGNASAFEILATLVIILWIVMFFTFRKMKII